jgi:hypothetical protein
VRLTKVSWPGNLIPIQLCHMMIKDYHASYICNTNLTSYICNTYYVYILTIYVVVII